jgi:XTP/dITP diphosphohydrolase
VTRLMLATGNAGKVRELARAFPKFEVSVAPEGFDPHETGDTLYQNAVIKVDALRLMVPQPVVILADDSGLFVHALDGRPGVYSARYAGESATYADNCNLLLKELQGVSDRSAAFVCVLVARLPDGRRLVAEGTCPGEITTEGRGAEGFGYDPVFLPKGQSRTMAEMSVEEKAAISHRGRAIDHMTTLLGHNLAPLRA